MQHYHKLYYGYGNKFHKRCGWGRLIFPTLPALVFSSSPANTNHPKAVIARIRVSTHKSFLQQYCQSRKTQGTISWGWNEPTARLHPLQHTIFNAKRKFLTTSVGTFTISPKLNSIRPGKRFFTDIKSQTLESLHASFLRLPPLLLGYKKCTKAWCPPIAMFMPDFMKIHHFVETEI
jgi:hypothetical protein